MKLTIPKPRQELTQGITRPSREVSEGRPLHLLWLDKNENTDDDYINLTRKIIDDLPASSLFGYPDCFQLYKKLAVHLDKEIKELFIAAGSDGIIRAVFETFVSPGDTVIYTEPTFAMYSLYAKMYGANPVQLHYQASANGPMLTMMSVISAIQTAKPRLVCLPNPNSPSGTVFNVDELRHIIQAAGEVGAVILIDEAYYPFYAETVIDWVAENPHLIVARTFSKAWGCAGIRLGFGIASSSLISELHKIRPMYEAGALSVMIAERLLDHTDAMLASVQRLNAGKHYFIEQMRYLGFTSLSTEGNFLHVDFGKYADVIHNKLAEKVLYRHHFSHPSLAGYSRFTATTKEKFSTLVKDISDVLRL